MDGPFKPEILVVDDDIAVRDSIALLLKASGYKTTTASNGLEALSQLKKSVPAILVSDLNMPEMSGFELLSVVRHSFPEVAVIAMSGSYRSAESVPNEVKADGFYAKGYGKPAKLLDSVADLIRKPRPTRPAV